MRHNPIVRRPDGSANTAPLIVERTDQDFIDAILDQLAAPGGLELLAEQEVKRQDDKSTLTLMQPVHRTFNVVLVDVACDELGQPRVDPRRIESAGLVVRRIATKKSQDGTVSEYLQGWVQSRVAASEKGQPLVPERLERRVQMNTAVGRSGSQPAAVRQAQGPATMDRGSRALVAEPAEDRPPTALVRGWIGLSPSQEALDPEPERRPPELRSGNSVVDSWLAALPPGELGAAGRESSSRLFVAPPDVCAATGRTLLYGLVPVTSMERSERPPEQPPYDEAWFEKELRSHLPTFMRAGAKISIPCEGEDIDFERGQSDATPADFILRGQSDATPADFILQLRQIKQEFDVFGERTPDTTLLDLLNRVTLTFPGDRKQPMGEFLRQASDVLLTTGNGKVTMPILWPSMDDAGGAAILQLIKDRLRSQLDTLVAGEGRYDDPDRLYCVRAFVRVRRDDGCPPQLIWSDYSERFRIARWYESSDAPPVRVELPDIDFSSLDKLRDSLQKLKPSVAFAVPAGLANFLKVNDPKKLLDGEGSPDGGSSSTLGWICSFSLPIITLCAYIVLNLFLSLFDLFLSWMIYVKICIPWKRR